MQRALGRNKNALTTHTHMHACARTHIHTHILHLNWAGEREGGGGKYHRTHLPVLPYALAESLVCAAGLAAGHSRTSAMRSRDISPRTGGAEPGVGAARRPGSHLAGSVSPWLHTKASRKAVPLSRDHMRLFLRMANPHPQYALLYATHRYTALTQAGLFD